MKLPSRFVARLGIFILTLTGLGLGCGCTTQTVQPWERAALTTYSMRPERDPLASTMSEHTWFSREAATGGRGVGGSGCGCN